MKFKFGRMTAMIMAGAMATAVAAHAQPSAPAATLQGAPASDLPLADYQAFDNFAIDHPDIVSDLSHHPQLLEDRHYLDRHPDLNQFLATHAELRGALIDDPGNFIEPRSGRHPREPATP